MALEKIGLKFQKLAGSGFKKAKMATLPLTNPQHKVLRHWRDVTKQASNSRYAVPSQYLAISPFNISLTIDRQRKFSDSPQVGSTARSCSLALYERVLLNSIWSIVGWWLRSLSLKWRSLLEMRELEMSEVFCLSWDINYCSGFDALGSIRMQETE